jgi:hypothetical protein
MNIRYYQQQKNLKNKAQTGLVTFDYFKKHFVLPLDMDKFEQLSFEEVGQHLTIPQFKMIICLDVFMYSVKFQGRVEGIIREIGQDEHEVYHVLLQEINHRKQ